MELLLGFERRNGLDGYRVCSDNRVGCQRWAGSLEYYSSCFHSQASYWSYMVDKMAARPLVEQAALAQHMGLMYKYWGLATEQARRLLFGLVPTHKDRLNSLLRLDSAL